MCVYVGGSVYKWGILLKPELHFITSHESFVRLSHRSSWSEGAEWGVTLPCVVFGFDRGRFPAPGGIHPPLWMLLTYPLPDAL